MSKYSEEIIKQAERLTEKHRSAGSPHITRLDAIKAAIVSCEFAIDSGNTLDEHMWNELHQVKSYLEELL